MNILSRLYTGIVGLCSEVETWTELLRQGRERIQGKQEPKEVLEVPRRNGVKHKELQGKE